MRRFSGKRVKKRCTSIFSLDTLYKQTKIFFKNRSLRFLTNLEQIEPHFGENDKNKNVSFSQIKLFFAVNTKNLRIMEPHFSAEFGTYEPPKKYLFRLKQDRPLCVEVSSISNHPFMIYS